MNSDGHPKNNQKFVQIQEAKTILIVPESSVTGAVPSKSPAFFNRLAKLNRDISVLAYRAFALYRSDSGSMPSIGNELKNDDFRDNDVITFADALSGTGARALRVAVEAPEIAEIYLNDVNRLAVNKSKLSAKINHVVHKCHFS